eukprot:Em0020g487a
MAEEPLKYLSVHREKVSDALAQTEWAQKKLVWVPHPEAGFLSGSIKTEKGDELTVELQDGSKRTVHKDEVQKMNPPKFEKVEDMAELSFLNEASVLYNLQARYFSGLIYTYSGLFCVVVNPYRMLPIYTETVVDLYRGKKRHELPPHIYAVTEQAFRNMLLDHENQSILCTGESGAGKTENTKKVIQYLTSVAAAHHPHTKTLQRRGSSSLMVKTGLTGSQGELEAQLLQANPILEAFGNAKTVKNDNSSRFLTESKKKCDELQAEVEEAALARRKQDKELEGAREKIDELTTENQKLSQSKKRVQEELDDLTVSTESLRGQIAQLDKKQKKFDTQLAEEHALAERYASERDMAETRARQVETRSLSLTHELEEVREKLEEAEKFKKQLQGERDALVESKDDVGKNVHELEKAKKSVEAELAEVKQMLEEAEDQIQLTEDAKLRIEVNFQALKTNYERDLAAKEEQTEEARRKLTLQLRDLEGQMEEERKQRTAAQNGRKKLESDIHDLQVQLDAEGKGKEELQRQLKKVQTQLKESQMSADEVLKVKEDATSKLKELEKKVKTLETDLAQAQEEVAAAERVRRSAEAEKDELHDEVSTSGSKLNTLAEEKRQLLNRITTLEEDLEEEQLNNDAAQEKAKKALQQVDVLTSEIAALQTSIQGSEATKAQLEKQIKDLRERLEEAESVGVRKMKGQLQSMEEKIRGLEEQLDTANKDRAQLTRTQRRQEKKLKEVQASIDDERRAAEQFKAEAEKAGGRMRTMKRSMDEMEEENARLNATKRRLQRELEELTEQNEQLTRDLHSRKGGSTSSASGAGAGGAGSRRSTFTGGSKGSTAGVGRKQVLGMTVRQAMAQMTPYQMTMKTELN